MADYKKDGKYLPEGIYMEATALAVLGINGRGGTYHSYLVYRDGQGKAEVIRGGMDFEKNKNFDLTTQVGKDLSESEDAYTSKDIKYFDQKTHLYAKLDTGNRAAKDVWVEMRDNANKIDPTINYNPKIDDFLGTIQKLSKDEQVALAKGTSVCHSVVGTVLKSSGMSIDNAIAKMNEANQGTKTITEDSFTGIKTDLLHDDVSRGWYDELNGNLKEIKNNTINKINKLERDTNRLIDEAKELYNTGKEIQKGIQELKRYINPPYLSDANDNIDRSFEQLAQASENLSLEQLIANEIGQDALDRAKQNSETQTFRAIKDDKDDNDNIRTANA